MQVTISGQHISVSESLTKHVQDKLNDIVTKYVDAISASVNFTTEGTGLQCNLVIHEGAGKHVMKSSEKGGDVYSAFDAALHKITTQLKKYKDKIRRNRNHNKAIDENISATKYVMKPFEETIDSGEENQDNDYPIIITEKPVNIPKLNVSEAVMIMDLEDLPALMFENSKTNRLNVVYYRKDGNISWVDSK